MYLTSTRDHSLPHGACIPVQALTQLYAVLNQLAEQLALAKTEIWVSGCGGRPFLLPGLPFWHPHSTHLPWKGLEEVATAIRCRAGWQCRREHCVHTTSLWLMLA